METIRGIPDSALPLVLADLQHEGLQVISRTRAEDGTWTLVFGNEIPSQTDGDPENSAGNFVTARRTGPQQVLYLDNAGIGVLRSGGSRAWRNNNPGNIRKGSFTTRHGAIGDDGAFAIFPNEASGRAALMTLLRTSGYSTRTLAAAIARYAPAQENDTAAYVATVERDTGISRGTVLSTLDGAKMQALANAIGRMEGWKVGMEEVRHA